MQGGMFLLSDPQWKNAKVRSSRIQRLIKFWGPGSRLLVTLIVRLDLWPVEEVKVLSSIKSWAEEDRPREKFLLKGKNSLSDAELLAILIGSGSSDESAVELCRRILASVDNNLNTLGKISVADLQRFKGIGEAKALTIAAALELGRRRKESIPAELPQIRNSMSAFEHVKDKLLDLKHEEFWVLYLNRNNRVIKEELMSRGGLAGTVVDVRMIIKSAVDCLASSLILFHNHPSGNPKPSHEDLTLTKKVSEAARLLDINVNDHLIIYENKYTSFADEGLI
jgi:DNA repair protein RadC